MDAPEIEYRPLPGSPLYRVGEDGSVECCAGMPPGQWFKLRQSPHPDGYRTVAVRTEGRKRNEYVHRLVLAAFVGPCPEGMEGCHADGNPANNRVGNLRWDTHRANAQDMRRHGRTMTGLKQPLAKLNEEGVRLARSMRREGATLRAIAEYVGISRSAVHLLVHRRTWACVP